MDEIRTVDQHGVLSAQCVRVLEEPARVLVPGEAAAPEPHVHLVREGNVVKTIEVMCTCGQRMRLNCLYQ